MSIQNTLFFGDNLEILQKHIEDASIDLIYLDPPFNSNRDYNVLFKEQSGNDSPAQIKAFGDTWNWAGAAAAWDEFDTLCPVPKVVDLMHGFVNAIGKNDVTAYLVMMAPRLYHLHRVLKPTGSLYLHCDPTASHYLKLILDGLFGAKNFNNEIVWSYRKWSASTNRFLRNHDVIFFYSKGKDRVFNVQYVPLAPSTLKRFKGKRQDFADEERTRKILTDEESKGSYMPDVWPINALPAASSERLGYPTQKPLALLERIVAASSNEGDVVLDPFSGCGTTIEAAEKMNRRWIGIDITPIATTLIQKRLFDAFGAKDVRLLSKKDTAEAKSKAFKVEGLPTDITGARLLYAKDNLHKDFEMWAVGLVPAIPQDKKGADSGIDGIAYIHDGDKNPNKALVQVKGGHVTVSQVRDLIGTMKQQNAVLGLFVSLEPVTKPMLDEATKAGFYMPKSGVGKKVPAVQIRTVEELLNGHAFDFPVTGSNVSFKTAKTAKTVQDTNLGLDL